MVVLQVPFDDVQPLQRERAKRIVYGLIYGIGREKLGLPSAIQSNRIGVLILF